jgi:hypothetical protein
MLKDIFKTPPYGMMLLLTLMLLITIPMDDYVAANNASSHHGSTRPFSLFSPASSQVGCLLLSQERRFDLLNSTCFQVLDHHTVHWYAPFLSVHHFFTPTNSS